MEVPCWLEEPSTRRAVAFLEFLDELQAEGTASDLQRLAATDFADYLDQLKILDEGVNLPEDRVPMSVFWLIAAEEVVGEGRFRHALNADLEIEGGHIGYIIRPSRRRQGFGTRILALTLEKARERGLARVLVTCDTDNLASARIIEKNGGVATSPTIAEDRGVPLSRYWIAL